MLSVLVGGRPSRRFMPLLVAAALAAALVVAPPANSAWARADSSAPRVLSGPTVTSSPAGGDTYRSGETISVRVVFDEPVSVTGTPRLRVRIGDERRWLRYDSSGGADRVRVWSEPLQEWLSLPATTVDGLTYSLEFSVSVKAGDVDGDGISVGRNQMKLNGGTITDADGNAAKLAHGALPAQSAHKVNGRSNDDSGNDDSGNDDSGNDDSGDDDNGDDDNGDDDNGNDDNGDDDSGNDDSGNDDNGNDGETRPTNKGGKYLVPETPAGVTVTVSGATAAVSWDAPAKPRHVKRYRVQWRWVAHEFDRARSATVRPADAESGRLSYTLPGSAYPDRAYKVRVVAEGPAGTSISDVVLVRNDQNLIYDAMERLAISRYYNEQRWIRETWDYMTTSDDFYVKTTRASAWSAQMGANTSGPVPYLIAKGLNVGVTKIGYADAYLHEMAHVWTLGHGVASKPGPVAIGMLYFERRARGQADWYKNDPNVNIVNCRASELYADTLNALTPIVDGDPYNPYLAGYWPRCALTYPDKEALDVANSVSAGEMPDWLYSANDDGNGNLDLTKLWYDVTEYGKNRPSYTNWYRNNVVHQLRDTFGGYCSVTQARASAEGWTKGITNPWRDGGCTPDAPANVTAAPADRSLAVSWDKPARTGVSNIQSYIVQYKSGRQKFSTKRQVTVAGDTTTATIPGLRNGRKYTVRVIAVNLLDDHSPITPNDGWSEPSPKATTTLRAAS